MLLSMYFSGVVSEYHLTDCRKLQAQNDDSPCIELGLMDGE